MVPEGVAQVVEEDPDGGGGGALGGREPGGGDGRRDREHHHARHAVQDGAQVAHSGIHSIHPICFIRDTVKSSL